MTLEWAKERPVEYKIIHQLESYGYTYLHGGSLESERTSKSDVVLEKRLGQSVKRLNPWIDDNNIHKVIRSITHLDAPSLMENNEALFGYLVNAISVPQDLGQGKKNQTVRLIDFEDIANNEFLVVNQFHINGPSETIIPDVIVFINGLPIAVIECKSATVTEPISRAISQLTRYQRDVEKLFWYNHVMIACCDVQAKFGSIGSKARHYGEWKDTYPLLKNDVGSNSTPQDILVAGMLTKENLLDMIRNFVVYEVENGRTIKKVSRYQQFRATNKTINRILNEDKGGVIWATQGSGKSLTMVYLATKIRRLKQLNKPSIVIVTDRTDLDDQITKTFRRCGFPNPKQASKVVQLRDFLTHANGDTIMTTVQKFQESAEELGLEVLNDASNIIVMVDESHRTQYAGLAMNMRTALPNAIYLGFTGTPIDKEDRSTLQTFGPYIDTYSIQQAVDDGATLPIFYESRLPELRVEGESLDAIFDRVFIDYSEEDRERIKKRYANEESIIGSSQRIRQVCLDIIQHYENYIQPNGFKAQIVAINRETAVLYKEILDELNGPESVVIFSGNNNDSEKMKKYHTTKEQQKAFIERFKKPLKEDGLSFIIVCDMLLTGFDAPIEQVMYLDKPLKEHNLLQAIARTNRTYDKKTYGLIVDYYGVSLFLKKALAIFTSTDVEGALTNISAEIPRLETRHCSAMRFFDKVNKNNIEDCIKILEPEDVRHQFEKHFKRFSESMDMIMPNPVAAPYREDLKFLGKLRQYAKNRYRDEKLDISDCGEKVRKLIEDYIISIDVESLHKPISIFEKNFDYKVKGMTNDQAKASEMEHAIRHEIKVKMKENPVFYSSLKERLEELINRHREKRINDAQLAWELEQVIEEVRKQNSDKESDGLTSKTRPIFQLLQLEWTNSYEDNEKVKETTDTINESLSEYLIDEGISDKEDLKRQARAEIKGILRKAKAPREKLDLLAQQILELTIINREK
ncbi:type I restriction endonuclease subunit R [Gottfriedia solisilvae]|uniref:Type I restriction enzyme endonuclease subunit n=1 Tax=Gottfriedia solisilvae TaxID=1516104 RepID=A0A8J3EWZ1_9BACI|nr:type I restriction endonuclease subunit R [Gottfriedia solisilvae]GGI12577.1 type I deoxyribonuclease HsdR [Gottfriedia solisilvae]